MHGELGEVRHALRSLGKSPGFAIAAVLMLALGVGATTVIYSAVNRVILHPLPFTGEERLVFPWQRNMANGFLQSPNVEVMDAWEQGAHAFEATVRYGRMQRIMERDDRPQKISEVESERSLLFGVSSRDVPAFLGAGAVLVATAIAACHVPAVRATRVDPVRALRAGW